MWVGVKGRVEGEDKGRFLAGGAENSKEWDSRDGRRTEMRIRKEIF